MTKQEWRRRARHDRQGPRGDPAVWQKWHERQMPIDVAVVLDAGHEFPRTSTGRQDFGDLEFESYRRLGQFLVERALGQNHGFLATPRRARRTCRPSARATAGRRPESEATRVTGP